MLFRSVVPPVRDPMSLRDTDSGNLKRMAPGQAKKTIKLKPLTAKSTTGVSAADTQSEPSSDAASAIKLKPVATATLPSALSAKSSGATIKITPKMQTSGEDAASAAAPVSGLKPVASASAILRPVVPGATSGGLKPVTPGTASGLKPVVPGAAILRPVGGATAGGLKPVTPGTATGLKPVAAPEPPKPALSILRPAAPAPAPAPAPEAEVAAPAEAAAEPVVEAPKKLSIPRPTPAPTPAAGGTENAPKEALKSNVSPGVQPSVGGGAGLKLKNDDDKVEAENAKFEEQLKELKGESNETAPGTKVEPGIIFSICNWAAMLLIVASLVLATVQYLNQWQGKNIKLPGLENIADNPIGMKAAKK